MHELSICQALLTQVETLATHHQARQVVKIVVQLGPLSGLLPELLQQAFTLAKAGTIAQQADLVTELLPLKVYCPTCQTESEATPNNLTCHSCGNWQTKLVSGDEMLLKSVEMIQNI